MKQVVSGRGFKIVYNLLLGGLLSLVIGSISLAAPVRKDIHKVQVSASQKIPVMMLSLPGRGMLLSAPGEIATVVIENGAGGSCTAYLARTDHAGVLEVPVARTTHCPSPRIVVHR